MNLFQARSNTLLDLLPLPRQYFPNSVCNLRRLKNVDTSVADLPAPLFLR